MLSPDAKGSASWHGDSYGPTCGVSGLFLPLQSADLWEGLVQAFFSPKKYFEFCHIVV